MSKSEQTVLSAAIVERHEGAYHSALFIDDDTAIGRVKAWVFKVWFEKDYQEWLDCQRRVIGGEQTKETMLHKADLKVDSAYKFNDDFSLDIERKTLL